VAGTCSSCRVSVVTCSTDSRAGTLVTDVVETGSSYWERKVTCSSGSRSGTLVMDVLGICSSCNESVVTYSSGSRAGTSVVNVVGTGRRHRPVEQYSIVQYKTMYQSKVQYCNITIFHSTV
jgi:hypothetical protein